MSSRTSTIGFPRIGARRELKTVLERYWKGNAALDDVLNVSAAVETEAWRFQQSAGIELIGLDGTLYDHILDTTAWLGVAPSRFHGLTGYAQYFAMARGVEGCPALDMSKLFDTNYHFLVPELEAGFVAHPDFTSVLAKLERGQAVLGNKVAVPMIIGPITFVYLARGAEAASPGAVHKLLPAYLGLLKEFAKRGVPEVQLHEPYLVTSRGATLHAEYETTYSALANAEVPIHLVTYYDDLGDAYPWAVKLPVSAISMDFRGVPGAAAPNRSLELIKAHGGPPANVRLGAGVVDGRSVWADTAGVAAAIISKLRALGIANICVQSSAPLQHVPVDVTSETKLPAQLQSRLAFAVQKLAEMTAAVAGGGGPANNAVSTGPDATVLPRSLFDRSEPFAQRRDKQVAMPAFPTTSIGSFPQTAEVRRIRLQWRQGKISEAQYKEGVAAHIGYAIGMQDTLGLDVLVHGEAERTDMVEYFGQKLEGMAFTENGWVQSYGSRYIRPPLIVGDIKYTGAMTVAEFQIAQGLTSRPVKGMLTGPVTILNWSFPRTDVPRSVQAFQLALALREEVSALEAAGCKIVQMDEPALREGLPLKAERWDAYLDWAVDAFRLSTAVAQPSTQVVTHLCYSEFENIMGAIDRMDADVLTIENSRSGDDMIVALAQSHYCRDIGPGVYDVHSPVVPPVNFIKDKIRSFVATGILDGRLDRIWVNPDCGLKTRAWPETVAALRNMVQAAVEMRAEFASRSGASAIAAAATSKPSTASGGYNGEIGGGTGRCCCCYP